MRRLLRWPWWVRWPLGLVAILLAVVLLPRLIQSLTPQRQIGETSWGLTYSAYDARGKGLDPQATYLAILDELQPKRLRLVSYWDTTEPRPGQWNFSDLDFQVAEADKRGIPYTIALGRRVPRYPECFAPLWSKSLPEPDQQRELYEYERQVVERYRDRPSLERWQVENETNVGQLFGDCPAFSASYLGEEVDLVRSLSSKPIMLTGGGEILDQGFGLAAQADVFGTSLYRSSNYMGTFYYKPIPSLYYTARAAAIRLLHPDVRVVVTELQLEPWSGGPESETLTPEIFRNHVKDAQRTGLPEVYAWGAEYWYLRKQQGDPTYWELARDVYARSG